MPLHPHLITPHDAATQRFTSPSSGPRKRMRLPARTRGEHAQHLITQLQGIAPVAAERAERQKALGVDAQLGIYLAFESDPDFELKFESLDISRSGIELCSVKRIADGRTQAVVFVPDGKIEFFLKRLEAYRDENSKPRKPGGTARPKNQDLIESISNIRIAVLEALWTDDRNRFPTQATATTWEVWLRRTGGQDRLAWLRDNARQFRLTIGDQAIAFIDRTVVLVHGTAADLARSIEILGAIAELRMPRVSVSFFSRMTAVDQQAWVVDLVTRISPGADDSPFVCLLDTGINGAHPLIAPAFNDGDAHTYKPAWGIDDRMGHGTQMAGLAVYGDLTDALGSDAPVQLTHRVESVKIFNEADPHDAELYGAVTQESTYRVEVDPDRRRLFCMAVTATDGRDRGRPSSWSAAIDALAAGAAENEKKRLFVLSAGNTDLTARRNYPDSNLTDGVHDPAQAWNALTVGGYTEKDLVDSARFPGWRPLAVRGDLSPSSCTSTLWTRTRWPIKPDIVMEAGNMASNPEQVDPDYIDDNLQLLTTDHDFMRRRLLTTFGDTSASAALAARLAAISWAKYPNFTPETVRALMVHASDWTPAMLRRFTDAERQIDYEGLLRCFGYGVPNETNLLSSANNTLTLIAQDSIEPFFSEDDRIKTREMRLHSLPWPADILRGLENAPVTMRVTLSYFVEPSPGARGLTSKYGYQSHGLRFAVKTALETKAQFESRINKFAREEDYDSPGPRESGRWRFGYVHRSLSSLGSIHSDVWNGTAIDLASRDYIAVFPTMGWWSKRPQFEGWRKRARYSLIVTISTPNVGVDIYTPVANQIGVPIVVEV